MTEQKRRTVGTGSSRKVLTMLMAFNERRSSATADELARAVGVPLSTAYRYISLLREVGLLEEGPNGGFVVSAKVLPLARAAMAAHPLPDLAMPALREVTESCGETSLLLQRVQDHSVCIARCESPNPVRLSFDLGRPMPLHRGAAAKILLAAMPQAERQRYLASLNPAEVDREALERELEDILARGWSVSFSEVDQGIWAAAAPVTDGNGIIAAVTVAGFAVGMPEERRPAILATVRAAAGKVSERVSALHL